MDTMSATFSPSEEYNHLMKLQALSHQVMQQNRVQQQQPPYASTRPQRQQQQHAPLALERKAVGSPATTRQRAASCQSPVENVCTSTPTKYPPGLILHEQQTANMLAAQRKLERSFSEPVQSQPVENRPSKSSNINPSRYKTEMCRPFEESGHCKYGDKCQFAHGAHELRNLTRHPKYKTDLCRTFHTIGFCPYGPRCHFIHNEDEHKLNYIVQQKQQQAVQQAVVQQAAQAHLHQLSQQQRPKLMVNLPVQPSYYSPGRDSLGSTADSPPNTPPESVGSNSPQSLSPTSLSDHQDVFLSNAALTPPHHQFSFPNYMPPPTVLPVDDFPASDSIGDPTDSLTGQFADLKVTTDMSEPDSMAMLLAQLSFSLHQSLAAASAANPLATTVCSPATSTSLSSTDSGCSTTSSLNSSFLELLPPSPPESENGGDDVSRLQVFSQLRGQ